VQHVLLTGIGDGARLVRRNIPPGRTLSRSMGSYQRWHASATVAAAGERNS